MIVFNLLIRIVLIGFLSTSIFSDKDTKTEKDKEDSLETFLEDLTHFPGLLDTYRNNEDGKIYLLINEDQLEKEFIYFAHILDGIVEAGTWRGNYLDNGIIKFIKYFDQIRIDRVNTAYVFDENNLDTAEFLAQNVESKVDSFAANTAAKANGIADARVVTFRTDEGLFEPYGIADLDLQILYDVDENV